MGTTTSGIWFPEKGSLASPMEANFATMASSIDEVFASKYTSVFLTSETQIKALREGTPFYVTGLNMAGVKTGAVGVNDYRYFYNGIIVNTFNQNGYSGGSVVPGQPAILVSAPKIANFSIPYRVSCELSMMLRITGNCAGMVTIYGAKDLKREIRWHSFNTSGLYPVQGTLEVNVPAGQAEFFITVNSDPLSGASTEVLTVSTALTVSI